ncbi:MAG: RNase A-like domain-containing protein [Nocardioides sp.]|uniref:RNase A-like domain-containing protein n=1 Tax=Nocardioides sp. TaxID=35761 RepID=UPI0032664CF1
MRIHIESGGIDSAAEACRTANQIIALLCESLAGKLAGFAGMAGDDATSVEFASTYDDSARDALRTMAELTDAFVGVGRVLVATAANHRDAEAASAAVSMYTGTHLHEDDYVRVSPAVPPSCLGHSSPSLGTIDAFILDHVEGFVWPGADVELLLDAGTAWRRSGTSVANLDEHCAIAVRLLEDQVSPEVPLALRAFTELREVIRDTADALTELGSACEEYADAVRATHERTLALLAEIGQMIVEGLVMSAIIGGITGGLGAGAAGTAALARIAAQAPRFHALLTTLRIAGTAAATRVRAAREALTLARTRATKFSRVARNERGEVRLPGGWSGPRKSGWLRDHDVPPGHTIDKHVGKTVDDLIEQCVKDNKRVASSFATEADAERFVDKVLSAHTNEIREWLSSGTRRALPLEAEFGQATGTTVTKAGDVSSATGVRVVLIPTDGTRDGWQLLTAFPN